MFKTLLPLFFLCFSGFVSANLVTINYTGIIYNEHNPNGNDSYDFGYAVGDSITGSFVINLANLPTDSNSSSVAATYNDNPNYDSEFVTSSVSVNFESDTTDSSYRNYDSVQIQDSSTLNRLLVRDYDYVSNSDRRELNYSLINIYDPSDLNIFNGGNLDISFSLNQSQLANIEYNYGIVFVDRYDLDDVANTRERNYIQFNMTSLSYQYSASNAVPTPGIFVLSGLGFLVVFARRLRNA
ncbi:hypothetical protein [Glaciecola sp. 1036]|uniref:hypothetical protein n=1 Tax=Alteromonadaceae TaxID=72275 RepID=UPI003D034E8C